MGVRKNPACMTIGQILCKSLKKTFVTESKNEIPKTKINKIIIGIGAKKMVIGGINWNATIKIPKTINSRHNIRKDVKTELRTTISLGK